MPYSIGIMFALIALFAWGFGDFLIQRTTRLVGDFKALFYITIVGFFGLLPFVRNQITALTLPEMSRLTIIGVIIFIASLAMFEALKKGKIAVIEPIFELELPLIIFLSIIFIKEQPSILQFGIMLLVFIGIMLTVVRRRIYRHHYKLLFEKGTIFAIIGAATMAVSGVLVGVASKTLSPLLIVWCMDVVAMILTAFYLIKKGLFKNFIADIRKHPIPIIGQSVLDNMAWVAFGFATSIIPISITSAISEGYIILAVLLGILVNHEKLRAHQKVGAVFAIAGVILLSTLN